MIENFGKNIARLRKEYGFSQEELAEKIGLKKQSISNIERGVRYPTFETLEKLAQLFKATPTQLFGTPKEIAVSDTPIILDRIDEYNSKIQAILQIPDIVDTYKEEIEHLANQIEMINLFFAQQPKIEADGSIEVDNNGNVLYDKSFYERLPVETIEKIASDARTINHFFVKNPITEDDGSPYFDENGKKVYYKSFYERLPAETIEKIANDIHYIKNNKDNI